MPYTEPMSEGEIMSQSPLASTQQHSPWHSPVPYLFGGLAAMLGLIAFALLILACSYWRLSGYLEEGEGEGDIEAGQGKKGEDTLRPPPVYEEKILVIMAGQEKPTFLATPISSSRSSSFGENGSTTSSSTSSSSYTCSCQTSETEMMKQGNVSNSPEQSDTRRGDSETSNQTH